MTKLIFGSTALKFWFPDFSRNPNDLDYISKEKRRSSPEIEYHWTPAFEYILQNNKHPEFVDPDFLYTIKMSHAAWDIRWDKTIHDIKFLKSKNCVLDKKLFDLLYLDWEKLHGKKQVVLKGTPEEFFTSRITRVYNHEELHNLVKFYEKPLHERIRPDPKDVKVSKKLWNSLSFEDQLKCALEEAYVFAIERYHEFPPKVALSKALKQLITSSTKGYFNIFLIDNFFNLLYNSHETYFSVFEDLKNERN